MANSTAPATSAKPQPVLPQQVWYGIVCLIATAAAVNLSWLLWSRYVRYVSRRQNAVTSSAPSQRGSVSLKRVPNAVLAASRIVGFRWTIPGVKMMMLEILVTIAYIAAILVWTFVNTDELKNNKWRTKSGILAAAQLPLLVVLSSKNNIISLLTGIGHEKLNLMHRVTSRSVLILTWVHLWGCKGYFSSRRTTTAPSQGKSPIPQSTRSLTRPHTDSGYTSGPAGSSGASTAPTRPALPHSQRLPPPDGLRRAPRGAKRRHRAPHAHAPRPGAGPPGSTSSSRSHRRPLESHPFTIASIPADAGPESELASSSARRAGSLGGCTRARCRRRVQCAGVRGWAVWMGSGVTYTLPRLQGLLRDVNAGKACAKRILFIWIIREEAHMEWISSALAHAVSSPPPTSPSQSTSTSPARPERPPTTAPLQKATDIEKGATCFETQITHVRVWKPRKLRRDVRARLGHHAVRRAQGRRPDVRTLLAVELAAAQGPVVWARPARGRRARRALFLVCGAARVLRGAPTVQLNVEQFRM
ncbi:Ferric/cupric reductase transmembrane component 7 [Grifola frondosa]|uniref:Ferric/cupric reductase transmembrane component 7 n=1 Tax=Grifola frondosa TaxID=5627 RepID=A0A1C7M0D6_GRIFR|nr:Ferric/cupric reductase transmembrane component 7 [Grifola frondosa]